MTQNSKLCCYCLAAQSCPTLCNPRNCSMLGFLSFTISWSFLKLMSIRSVMPFNHVTLCCPFSSGPQSFPTSGSFPMSQLCIRRPKCWNFTFSISPSNEYSGLMSFRTDWFDLCVVQETLKSLLQHHSSKASNLRRSAFFIV